MKRIDWGWLKQSRLTPGQQDAIAEKVLGDFRLFCRLCEPPAYDWSTGHDDMAAALCSTEQGADGRIRILLEAPRKAGKSTMAVRHALWRIVRSAVSYRDERYKKGSIRVLYCSETDEKTEETPGAYVYRMLTRSNITKVFGRFRDPAKWSPSRLIVRQRKTPMQDATWTVGAPDKSTEGGHFDLGYIDDVVTQRRCRTINMLDKTAAWFDEVDSGQMDDRSEVRVLGTRHHDDDLYGRLEETPGWNVTKLSILNATFPNLPPDVIAGIRQSMSHDPARFACYYLNEPVPTELQVFSREQFRHAAYTDEISGLPRYVLTDFAASRSEMACETALWVVALDHLSNVYCLDLRHGHWEPSESMEVLTSLFIKWTPRWGVVENRLLTAFVGALVQAQERSSGVQMPFRVASAAGYDSDGRGTGKDLHIRRLEPRFREGKIYFCDTMPPGDISFRKVVDKMVPEGYLVKLFTRFPKTRLKDCLDALAYVDCSDKDGARLCPIPASRGRSSQWQTKLDRKSAWHMPAFRRRVRKFTLPRDDRLERIM